MTPNEIRVLNLLSDWNTEILIWGKFHDCGSSWSVDGIRGLVVTALLETKVAGALPAIKVAIDDCDWKPEWGENDNKTWFLVRDIERIEVVSTACRLCHCEVAAGVKYCEDCKKGEKTR